MGNMLDKREEAIMNVLQRGNFTLSEINERLPIKLRYTSKTWKVQLSKRLATMKDKKKIIDKIEENIPYPLYTIKKTHESITQLDGSIFNLNLGTTLFNNRGKIIKEIGRSRTNKDLTIDDNYTKSVIEFLGIYLFSMLIRSYDIPMKINANEFKNSRNGKKENDVRGRKYNELKKCWLSKALSLEEGVLKTSSIFNDLIVEFADFIKEYDKTKTINKQNKRFMDAKERMIYSFEKQYPQTSGMILNVMSKSDDNLNYLKKKDNTKNPISKDLVELLTKK